jgi:hypothetical protein
VKYQQDHPSKLLSDSDNVNTTGVGTVSECVCEAETWRQQFSTRPAAYTIAQFCRLHGGLSKATFYNLRKRGLAPKTFVAGRRRLVSVETAEKWRRSMEQAQGLNSPEGEPLSSDRTPT